MWAYHEPKTESGRVQHCVALAHAGNDTVRDVLLERLARLDFDAASETGKVAIVRANQLADLRLDLADEQRAAIAVRFEPRYPSGSAALDRELLQLLVGLGSDRALVPALDVLESDALQEERIWAAYCLRVATAGWTPELRQRQFRGLASLRSVAEGGHSLVKYVDEIRRQSAANLDDAAKAELGELLDAPKPVASAQAVAKATFVRKWTREDLASFVREALVGRDFERGKATFAKARCVECHRMAGEGGGTGPDLTGAGSRFSRSDWLDSLLEPSKVISDQYQDTEILTTDGDLLVGRIERDDPDGITLRRLPPQEDAIDLAPTDIERRRPYPMSRMPSGLLDVLDEDEIRDLAAYVLSGANPSSAEFRKP
jgi:putative heme-binding domain-containing protein